MEMDHEHNGCTGKTTLFHNAKKEGQQVSAQVGASNSHLLRVGPFVGVFPVASPENIQLL
jgi:hypothetical protein